MRWFALASLLLASSPAFAQGPDLARARTLFQTGLEAAHADRWEDARAAFRDSLAIAERPSTLVNLAGAEAETGHLVDAAASYRRFLELATGPRDARLRQQAEAALAAVLARTPHVTLTVEGRRPGDEVRLDGTTLTPAALAGPIALDGGSHLLLVARGASEVARRGFGAREGETVEVTLVVPGPAETPAPMDQVIAVPVDAPPPRDDSALWIGLGAGLGALVVVGVVVGVVVATSSGAAAPYTGNFADGVLRF